MVDPLRNGFPNKMKNLTTVGIKTPAEVDTVELRRNELKVAFKIKIRKMHVLIF